MEQKHGEQTKLLNQNYGDLKEDVYAEYGTLDARKDIKQKLKRTNRGQRH